MTPKAWRRIEDLFQAVVEKPLADREGLLAAIRSSHPDLHQEVASLVAAHEQAEAFLSMPPLFASGHSQTAANPPQSMIGPYRIDREIGSGGMGTVYAASRADSQFARRVALKVVRAGLESESILARFRAERQILATLDHPNIARLLDGGVTPEGRPFLVTELIDGVPLNEYCASRNLSVNARLDLCVKICAAVQYAHQRLVIHRDIKPGNILVDGAGEPKLLDFGIAKIVDPEHPEPAREVRTVRLLTPRYASPEQLRSEPVTTATDIYSLGVVFYELLAGRHPFDGSLANLGELRRATLEDDPERLSEINEQLAGDLENILLMALRKQPDGRYRSAAQLAGDIRRYRHNLPVAARKDTLFYVASKFVARHTLPTFAIFAVFVLLATAVAVAAHENQVAREERAKAEFIENFVKTTLSGADPTYNSPFADKGRDLRVADVLDVAAARARAEMKSQPALAAELLREFGIDYFHLGLWNEAEVAVRDALRQQQIVLGPGASATRLTARTLNEFLSAKSHQ